jgi:hypothetical protein
MFTKMVKMIVAFQACMSGHCSSDGGGGGSGHCSATPDEPPPRPKKPVRTNK